LWFNPLRRTNALPDRPSPVEELQPTCGERDLGEVFVAARLVLRAIRLSDRFPLLSHSRLAIGYRSAALISHIQSLPLSCSPFRARMPSMGRRSSEITAGLCLALAAAGCSTMRSGNPFASASKPSSGPAATQTAAKSGGAKSPGVVDKKKDAAGVATQTADGRLHDGVKHSPEVVALAERELADAGPEERESLVMALKDLPDESVKQVLSARRKGLRYSAQQAAAADQQNASRPSQGGPGGGVIQQAGGIAAGGSDFSRPGHSPNGLGSMNAWGQAPGQPAPSGQRPGMPGSAAVIQPAEGVQPIGTTPHGSVQQALGEAPAPFGHGSGYRSPVNSVVGASATELQSAAKPNSLLGSLAPGNYGPPATGAVKVGAPASVAPGSLRDPNTVASGQIVQTSSVGQAPTMEHLARLIAVSENDVARVMPGETEAEKRIYIEKHVYLRMLYLMAGQQERALQAIPGIEPADQEFFRCEFHSVDRRSRRTDGGSTDECRPSPPGQGESRSAERQLLPQDFEFRQLREIRPRRVQSRSGSAALRRSGEHPQ
jgi:hypothetical protein